MTVEYEQILSLFQKPDYKILNYCSNAPTKPENCVDLMCLGKNTSGTYEVFPADAPTKGYKVYCDQESNGGGWMVGKSSRTAFYS